VLQQLQVQRRQLGSCGTKRSATRCMNEYKEQDPQQGVSCYQLRSMHAAVAVGCRYQIPQ